MNLDTDLRHFTKISSIWIRDLHVKHKITKVLKNNIGVSLDDLKVKVAQLCPTLCNPMDGTFQGIFWARILEWVAVPFSRGVSQPRDGIQVSHVAGGFFTNWATTLERLLDRMPNEQSMRKIIGKLNFIEIKFSAVQKTISIQLEDNL